MTIFLLFICLLRTLHLLHECICVFVCVHVVVSAYFPQCNKDHREYHRTSLLVLYVCVCVCLRHRDNPQRVVRRWRFLDANPTWFFGTTRGMFGLHPFSVLRSSCILDSDDLQHHQQQHNQVCVVSPSFCATHPFPPHHNSLLLSTHPQSSKTVDTQRVFLACSVFVYVRRSARVMGLCCVRLRACSYECFEYSSNEKHRKK